MSGSAVPEGFTLPWNTTRTMADVWSRSERAKLERQELRRQADACRSRNPGYDCHLGWVKGEAFK